MMWKIIFVLPCFTVLVNAVGNHEEGSTSTGGPTPFPNIEDWADSLEEIKISDWSNLSTGPSPNQKDLASDALKNSGCPTDIVEVLLLNSYIFNWPDHFKERNPNGYKTTFHIKYLACRRIPGAPVVYVSHISNIGVPEPGLLFVFDKLE
ncbi:E3 ubiquitin-protein ligase NRDP1-like [Adelges cooleyi]|uniref:E3 ubiquitin-protein ligase NRDP1-like n=1 Tax=Adelges cooleyi TaxID=133065 RepID=UPI00217F7521|nr:E3 ubiquitin-protein ligase NRDP1-like [Adelges cooleyi]XP_050427509.1 E3 ubiquitin-protein ligase NRDP1-like [Adelges cooleyi]XP_050439740.1 E3 ubiquitin-protein ligase NRDP1-like [Adelges cooleyi]